jgi:hypothetical protein
MKKNSRRVKRSPAKKSSSRKNIHHVLLLPFSLKRIVLVTTCIALFIFVFTVAHNHGRQGVAGINITKGLFAQSTIAIPQVENAVSYNIYYKEKNENVYKNAVRSIPPTINEYTISYLTKNAEYTYKISAVDSTGAEFWWSEEKSLDNLQPM